MSLVSDIITDAYQYNNLVALSEIPTAAEQAKALRYLNRIIRSTLGNEVGEALIAWEVGGSGIKAAPDSAFQQAYQPVPTYRVPFNSRLVLNLTGPLTVYLNPSPQNGERLGVQDVADNLSIYPFTVNANGRKIEAAPSVVLALNSTNTEWMYRSDLGNWVKVTNLSLSDEMPFPLQFDEFFITALALRLGASEDIDLGNQLTFVLKSELAKLRSTYRVKNEVGSERGLVNTTWARSHYLR